GVAGVPLGVGGREGHYRGAQREEVAGGVVAADADRAVDGVQGGGRGEADVGAAQGVALYRHAPRRAADHRRRRVHDGDGEAGVAGVAVGVGGREGDNRGAQREEVAGGVVAADADRTSDGVQGGGRGE